MVEAQQHQEKDKEGGQPQTSALLPTSDPATSSLDGEKTSGRNKDQDQGKNETRPISRSKAQDGDGNSETDDASKKNDDDQPPLPFSKARCIALVATLTGASFLNASPI